MKLQQLRFLCEVIDSGFNISRAAEALFTSQPGISRQIGLLEQELGVDLIVRRGNKLLGLTPAGVKVADHARSALSSTEAIARLGKEFSNPAKGTLTVATTHTHARYVLPDIIREFSRAYPQVGVNLMQGLPDQIAQLIRSGGADVALATLPRSDLTDIALVRCYEIDHILIAAPAHPLLKAGRITLASLARYPIIGYDDSYQISRHISERFRAAGISPRVVMRASDSDVIKTYVAAGMGIAIIPAIAFEQKADSGIRSRSLGALFEKTNAYALFRKGLPARAFMYSFLNLVSPRLTREVIDAAILDPRR